MHDCLLKELKFRTSRSSGPGGQHVNKTESRVELIWNLKLTRCLDPETRSLLAARMKHRLTDEGLLILASGKFRSQARNREEVQERFLKLVSANLKADKPRHPTKPTRASIEKRIKNKKIRGDILRSRRNITGD